MMNKQVNAAGLVVGFIILALVICAVAAWLTGNALVLLPSLALLPGLVYAMSQRKAGNRRG
jgi:hypothetical protein